MVTNRSMVFLSAVLTKYLTSMMKEAANLAITSARVFKGEMPDFLVKRTQRVMNNEAPARKTHSAGGAAVDDTGSCRRRSRRGTGARVCYRHFKPEDFQKTNAYGQASHIVLGSTGTPLKVEQYLDHPVFKLDEEVLTMKTVVGRRCMSSRVKRGRTTGNQSSCPNAARMEIQHRQSVKNPAGYLVACRDGILMRNVELATVLKTDEWLSDANVNMFMHCVSLQAPLLHVKALECFTVQCLIEGMRLNARALKFQCQDQVAFEKKGDVASQEAGDEAKTYEDLLTDLVICPLFESVEGTDFDCAEEAVKQALDYKEMCAASAGEQILEHQGHHRTPNASKVTCALYHPRSVPRKTRQCATLKTALITASSRSLSSWDVAIGRGMKEEAPAAGSEGGDGATPGSQECSTGHKCRKVMERRLQDNFPETIQELYQSLSQYKQDVIEKILQEQIVGERLRHVWCEDGHLITYNRQVEKTKYNNGSSSNQTISHGVPQGSILGLLLFLLYVNDMVNVSNLLFFILFAIDTNIYGLGL
ncbi:hypothetical protein CAPTEDRAFT_198517 [Capitella teleta]|uniref:Reverse transcriptase domain-containing protein n=1 Tax=Capitella teleta TaxID=283909 RepID=R7U5C8_CAPTE|nr:hypothetical protein CAPTEDRAFT_198517 [Capitella teleta]|eukprot:ELT98891.1 hypothetical protein CAPTEDRAFT_198517 [Capitella teleta]